MRLRIRSGASLILLLIGLLPFTRADAQPLVSYFGDSITEGWIEGARRPQDAFPARTDQLLTAEGVSFRSQWAGRGGETTADGLLRIDEEVLTRSPAVVVIAFGSNDHYIWGEPPFLRVPPEQFHRNLRLLVRKVRGIGAQAVLLGMPPVLSARFHAHADSVAYLVHGGVAALHRSYEDVIAAVAREESCPYVPLSGVFTDADALLGFDGVHPLPAGHGAIASALAPTVAAALRSGEPSAPVLPFTVHPNPFRPAAQGFCLISIALEAGARLRVSIHDHAGRRIRNLVYYAPANGMHYIPWNGRTDGGTIAAPGAYTLYIESETSSVQQRILLM